MRRGSRLRAKACPEARGVGIPALVHASGQYYVSRIAYSVLLIAYFVKYNIIYVIFYDTVQDNISRGLAETMIMAGIPSGEPRGVRTSLIKSSFLTNPDTLWAPRAP